MFHKQKEIPTRILIVIFLLFLISTLLVVEVIYPKNYFMGIANLSHQLLQATTITYLFFIIIFVFGFLFIYLKMKPKELGLGFNQLKRAIVVFLIIIVIQQIVFVILNLFLYHKLQIDSMWLENKTTLYIGSIICQLFFVAVLEEILFRGFLFQQVYLKLKTSKYRLTWALIISQTLFALWHIPVRIYEKNSLIDIIFGVFFLLIIGIFFAFLYIRTKNLFIVMIFHGLWNEKITFINSGQSVDYFPIILVLSIILVILIGPKLQIKEIVID